MTPTGRLVHKIDINSSPARFYITKGDFQKKVRLRLFWIPRPPL